MQCLDTGLPEVKYLLPQRHADARGWFMEAFQQARFTALVGRSVDWIQDNHSQSRQGVLRGLHWQVAPMAQAKLVRCVAGAVWDVAVDVRLDSPRRGQWTAQLLSADNAGQLWIPEGFAHGFLVLSEVAEVLYKVNAPYSPAHERCLRWDDAGLGIAWPAPVQVVSERDQQGMSWSLWCGQPE